MKQVYQDIKNREVKLADVPQPQLLPGMVLVKTVSSLISAGTEKNMVDLAEKSLLGKARSRPDLVKQVLEKAKKEGWWSTFQTVRSRMEQPMPLGYSASGTVIGISDGVSGVHVGQRVAIAGAGYANHAEVNVVPQNLVAKIPRGVSFDSAAYTTVASIAMQGVRLAKPEVGDYAMVIGLGLIGLITVQILQSAGCQVIGCDPDRRKVERALGLGMNAGFVTGADDPDKQVQIFTHGRGIDRVLITASTKSNDPVELAAEVTRRRAIVVVVGLVGMNLPRSSYYLKELTLKVSMSYGPGRYDPSYEEGGVDYPYEYVRWTEQRNMESVLALMSTGGIDVESLTTHRFQINEALQAYEVIKKAGIESIGLILHYPEESISSGPISISPSPISVAKEELRVGFIGAGNYATRFLIPTLVKHGSVQLVGLVTATGPSAKEKALKNGFEYCSTDADDVFADKSVDAVFIGTRHSTHAELVISALRHGKHVFVEKPLGLDESQLSAIKEAYIQANQERSTKLMVGLNRRFSPLVIKLKKAFKDAGPLQMIYRVNSGYIPLNSWHHHEAEGGGMLIGEMVHFLDLMQFVCQSEPVKVFGRSMSLDSDEILDLDNVTITLSFNNGSTGVLVYNTVGDKSYPKERLEVYGAGNVAVLDDFRSVEIIDRGKKKKHKLRNQDKGQHLQVQQTVEAFMGSSGSPIEFTDLYKGMAAVFAAKKSIQSGHEILLQDII